MLKHYLNKHLILLFVMLIGLSSAAIAQKISGQILDANATPIIGASVVEAGTTNGVITDFEGAFSLELTNKDAKIKVSFIGYESQEITVGNQSFIKVTLTEDVTELEELVVIGYGTQKKQNITGAIASIDSKAIEGRPVADVQSALQGQVAGVQISTGGTGPGAESSVRIRGTASITGGSDPLYVVDGFIMANGGAFTTINPSDIESINVLKDASAAAIYGARAANGVVIITTKRGKGGATRFNVNTFIGTQAPTQTLDLLNAEEYRTMYNMARDNAGKPRIANLADESQPLENNTDWQKETLQRAPMKNFEFSAAGGSENAHFYTSVRHYDEAGMINNTGFDRTSIRFNGDARTGRFKMGASLYFSNANYDEEFNTGDKGMMFHAISNSPAIAVRDENNVGGFNGPKAADGYVQKLNPVAATELVSNRRVNNRFVGNVYGEFEILEGLVYKMNGGADYSGTHRKMFAPYFDLGNGIAAVGLPNGAELQESRGEFASWLFENTLNYKTSFGKHSLGLLAGHSAMHSQYGSQHITVVGGQLSQDFPQINGSANVNGIPQGFLVQERTLSYIGRAIYDYDEKYLATFNFRRDGSSKFSKENFFDNFYSGSVGWLLSKEDFFKNDVVNYLKIRASYGFLGNDKIDANATRFIMNLNSRYPFGGSMDVGVAPGDQLANQNLVWEKQQQMNIGADFALLKNKLTGTIDYFVKNSNDLLISYNLPRSTGGANMFLNAGEVQNKGVELSLNYTNKVGELNYNFGVNGTYLTNEVTALVDGVSAINRGRNAIFGDMNRIEPGNSLFAFYGLETDGIYKSQDEITNGPTPLQGTKPGDFRFKDISGPEGVPDGKIDGDDRTFIGDGNQDFVYGFNLGLNYKRFDFSMQWQGVQGNDVYSTLKFYSQGYFNDFNMTKDVLNAWTPQNPNSDQPRAIPHDQFKERNSVSSYWIQDGSYLRLKNLQVGYSFNMENVAFLNSLRVYAAGQNLLTFTKYQGYDPEVAFSGIEGTRIYPTGRSLIVGVQVGF
ncbi:TonB-dependent receptor [Persicobacter psychrovividus]|uniref:SusC/RagA family TonB-linked outer membrane protein n=1 Tax=Persicobacter psychrovividus TaxID=387638 RepID=A0ABN6LBU6_9BACT|nr:SusC/RagA family TonB-linked outer membrane protein [Persicobacter psychrovividus]